MSLTISKLAQLSGVSTRALRWYDEIGLLKPAYFGENGYRYYEEEQLLILQQILFFRELGFSLEKIEELLEGSALDRVSALRQQRQALEESRIQAEALIRTIDKTIDHLKGEREMDYGEFFDGFDPVKQKVYEEELKEYIAEKGIKGTESLFDTANDRTRNWRKEDWDDVKAIGETLNQDLLTALLADRDPKSDAVQALIRRHFESIRRFYEPTKEVYMGLADLYCEHPGFREYYGKFHPDLPDFLRQGMHFFAQHEINE